MDLGVFLGYSTSSKAYRVFNKRTLVVEESMHVTFDETSKLDLVKGSVPCDDVVGGLEELNIGENAPQKSKELDKDNESQEKHALDEYNDDQAHVDHQQVHGDLPRAWKFLKDHRKDYIIGENS